MLDRNSEEYKQHLIRFYGFSESMVQRIVDGMGCGVSIGKGWVPMVKELDAELAELTPDYTIDQIKEKFGGLRYYVSGVNDAGYQLIGEAEEKSFTICDKCGEPGELRKGGCWLRTLCNEHEQERQQGKLRD